MKKYPVEYTTYGKAFRKLNRGFTTVLAPNGLTAIHKVETSLKQYPGVCVITIENLNQIKNIDNE